MTNPVMDYATKWVRGIDMDKLMAAGRDKVADVLLQAVANGWVACREAHDRGDPTKPTTSVTCEYYGGFFACDEISPSIPCTDCGTVER